MRKLSIWNVLLFFIIIFYIYFVVSQILFKYISPFEIFNQSRYFSRSLNLIPFNDLFRGVINKLDLYGNIIIFFPFGILFNIIKEHSFFKNIFAFSITSLIFEILQYILAIGASDITDIILNTLGGVLGLMFYNVLKMILKKEIADKIIIVLATILMIFVITILILIKIYN